MGEQKSAMGSKILVMGATGNFGKFIVEASRQAGHPTYALVRHTTANDPTKAAILNHFATMGVSLCYGDLYDHDSLVNAIRVADVVVSCVGSLQIEDQTRIIAAIKDAGCNIKRFLPSEFGIDVDHVNAVEPAKSVLGTKAKIRRAIEAEGIPYTYVAANYFAGFFLPSLGQLVATSPPSDKIAIYGHGNTKAIFNHESDIASYTIRAVDDPTTLNKTLFIKPPLNTYTFNELVTLWEKIAGKVLEKNYILEQQLLNDIQGAPMPVNVILGIHHSVFVKGDQTNFEINSSKEVEASQLYPDVKYTSVEKYLKTLFNSLPAQKDAYSFA